MRAMRESVSVSRQPSHANARSTNSDPTLTEEPWVSFSSGYIQRALARQPKQGSKRPWKLYQNYAKDMLALRFGKVDDGVLVFSKAEQPAAERLRA
jgi:hypothetical protein